MPSLNVLGFGTVDYEERAEGSPTFSYSSGASRAERTFRVPWAKKDAFVRGMLGFPRIKNTKPGQPDNIAYVSRALPQPFPGVKDPNGDEEWLYATAVTRLEGAGPLGTLDDSGVTEYEYAIVTVQYESLTYKLMTDEELDEAALGPGFPDESYLLRYVTRVTKPSAEYVTLPRGAMRWYLPEDPDYVAGAAADRAASRAGAARTAKMPSVDFANARLVPSTEIVYTWHQVPFIPKAIEAGTKTYVGCVNKNAFGDQHRNYAPGTLLLLSAELKPYRTGAGAFVHDIAYRVKYFEPEPGRGHNYFLRYDLKRGTLAYTKLTSGIDNDEVKVSNPSAAGAGPYTREYPPGAAPDVSRSLYPYVDFDDLFRFYKGDGT